MTRECEPHESALLDLLSRCGPNDEVRIEVKDRDNGLLWVVMTDRKSKKVLNVPGKN